MLNGKRLIEVAAVGDRVSPSGGGTPVIATRPRLPCELLDIREIPTARILESTYAPWTH